MAKWLHSYSIEWSHLAIKPLNSVTIQQFSHPTIFAFTYFCTVNIYRKATILLFSTITFLCLAHKTMAQQRSDTLKEVEIKTSLVKDTIVDKRSEFSAGQASYAIQKIYKDLYESQSLSNLLSQQSSVFIKSYGVNSMATLSLRGASAAQSAVLWNGVPIMNPAQGVADLSVLQTGLFSDVTLKYGGSAALYGSGNVGGALLLDNQNPNFAERKNLFLTLGTGSFGAMNTGLNASFQNKKWSINLNGFYQKADNDIKYTDASGNAQRLDNAHLQGGGGLLSVDYNLKKYYDYRDNERLYLKIWWQAYDREIPPALFEAFSDKRQNDRSLRTMLGYEKNTERGTLYIKGSYSNEYLHYQDSAVAMDNRNTVHQIYGEAGWKYRLNQPRNGNSNHVLHELLFFTPIQFSIAEGNNILTHESQFRPAIAAAYRFEGLQGRLKANAALRQEWINGNNAPILPGFGAAYDIWKDRAIGRNKLTEIGLLIRGNVQRTYRIPTLNELYYFPGGNPDLKPEQGWSEDAGYSLQIKHRFSDHKVLSFTNEINGFNRNIQDWIYWLGGAIWTPHNIAKVHSRGLETNNRLSYQMNDITFNIGCNYTYVLSTTEASYIPGDGSIGKQIPYTPRYSAQGNAGVQWKGFFFNLNQTYTGYRFVTVDESQYLDPYNTTNVQMSYGSRFAKKYFITITGQLQNAFNTDYEVVNARPMPGRNFLLQLKLGI